MTIINILEKLKQVHLTFTFHRRRTEVQIIYFYICLYFVYDALFVYFPLLHLKRNLSRKCV